MVARISSGTNPGGAVYYNENKVGKGEAERLAVRNYRGVVLPVEQLGVSTVTAKLERQASNNDRIKKPTFHASLSLAQGEKPSPQELLAVADRYMQGMGYSKQPYVVYQHHDTDHTHIHIVSVRVDDAGKKIPDNHEHRRSNTVRQEIEKEFGLVVAEKAALRPERKKLEPVQYGSGDLKRDVAHVVNTILRDFKFSSFAQFNQALGHYNVKATEVTVPGKKPGLIYSVLDEKKVAQGTTLKASTLPLQPTMEVVNRRLNAGKKVKEDRVKVTRKVAKDVHAKSKDWGEFKENLIKAGIIIIPILGVGGVLFGLSYLDLKNKTVYGGSELGKSFTAGSLKKEFGAEAPVLQQASRVRHADEGDVLSNHQKYDSILNPTYSRRPRDSNEQKPNQSAYGDKQTNGSKAHNETKTAFEHEPGSKQAPMENFDLLQHMLRAVGDEQGGVTNDNELKKMLKNARRPRLS